MVEFYRAEKVNDRITAIRSLTGEIMYLLNGEEKALLIDTCVGAGNLRDFVEKLTDKPLTVLLTHGHIDHAMGAPEFVGGCGRKECDVYMNYADTPVYLGMNSIEARKGYVMANLGGHMPEGLEETFLSPSPMTFKNLKDGDRFELGGISAEVYALPGHTQGTMVVLIPEERILILGDGCNKATFLFDENSLTVEEYRRNLAALDKKMEGRFDRVFICHHDMEMQKNIMKNVILVCDTIMAGMADDVPFEFMGQKNYIAKAVGERMNRQDGIDGNIIYNKKKVKA